MGTPLLYPYYAGKVLLDVELGIPLGSNVNVAVGGENVLNTYRDVNQHGMNTVGNQYGQFSPCGFNGANFYVRLNFSWGQGRAGGLPTVLSRVLAMFFSA